MSIKTIENEAKEQKGGFVSMILGTLAARLFGYLANFKIQKYYQNKSKFKDFY